jgi:hypothetical protein
MNRSYFPEVDTESGFAETYLKSWKQFHIVVQKLLRHPSYIFRGQRDANWLLEPSLTRLLGRVSKWKRHRDSYMSRFRLALRGRLDDQLLGTLSDDEILAIGQHFGLATPLLDWSRSPYVALFFAFEAASQNPRGYRSIYALHEQFVRGATDEAKTKAIHFIVPTSGFNKRLVNQAGLFTKSPPFMDIQTWVETFFPGVDDAILIKVNIPSMGRHDCLRALNRMNINHSSLFPDIDGAARYCNMEVEISDY